ncbi:TKL protein kinase [Saprolegnia parasitica CBS 223.65]|uniref:TKL protein kinase n=1 Tax=Saprolegnia parasitica (strain CBS 223.65) TaxID=695850 RepID=A0A067CSN9_SAPPC|nr:TKL protein kinase [Saprolegnia parasitica CBS 223.65]KDO32250.1 TKL protein kinase [Saprolegnia parasitica CBS 223.65]|eukprot:XP_012196707.1 TKL protein kinase [Saprolegnia parasitica CBS 223.65]
MRRWLLLLPTATALLTQDPGTAIVTQTVGENMTLTLTCPDATTAINKILFASYGMPKGDGLAASVESYCDSPKSKPIVQSYCLQQQTCSLWAVNSWFTDECVGTGKHLTVTAQCAAATQTLVLDPGAVLATANVTENSTLSLSCPDASTSISTILFASYGLPSNVGLYAAKGKCDAANATQIVAAACLGKAAVFGNPCASVRKLLTVTAQCTSPSKSSSPTAIIVGVGCGVAVLIAVVGGYVFCSRRRKVPVETRRDSPVYQTLARTSNRGDPKPRTRNSSFATGPTGPTNGPNDTSQHHKTYPEPYINLDIQALLHHRLVLEDLRVTSKKPLASGAYGEVWLGVYGGRQVAIKRLKQKDPRSVQKFIDEIVLMSQLDSDYVIHFVGASWTRPIEIECVVEYMDLGDLRSYLMTARPGVFTWSQKYDVLMRVIHGLVYLHTFKVPIIHRDLKSRNILLDTIKGTKLTDFGASRAADDTMTNGIGTYQWMAPEIVAGTSYTAAADIYSFGVVLSELCTHKVPYADLRHPKTGNALQQHYILREVCEGRLHPTLDGVGVPTWVPQVATQCLQLNANDRPSALQLSAMLSKLRQNMGEL